MPSKFDPLKRAVATLIFAALGQIVGVNLFDIDMDMLQIMGNSVFGAAVNWLYRWAEKNREKGPYAY